MPPEIPFDLVGAVRKVDMEEAFIFVFAELLTKRRLPDAPCSFDKKGALSAKRFLERQELVVKFPFQ